MDISKTKKLAPEALFDYAVKQLGRRPLTEQELRARLLGKARSEEEAGAALERVKSLGYLDDTRTAESHAYGRREFQGYGRRRVLDELRQRGVADEAAERAVEETYGGSDEGELIRQYLGRRVGAADLGDPKHGRRALQRLLRAGFSSGKILEVLRQAAPAADWLDEIDESDLEAH